MPPRPQRPRVLRGIGSSNPDVGALRTAAGVGVRYRSPIGPIRIDVGITLQPQLMLAGARERRAVLHISLGQAF